MMRQHDALTQSINQSLISQNLKRSHDSEHMPIGSNMSCVHYIALAVYINQHEIWSVALPITKISLGQNFKNGSRDTDHAPSQVIYLRAKFDDSSFSRSSDMVGAHQNVNDLRDQTTPLAGMIYRPRASTCYDQPICQIWSLSPPTMKIWKAIQNVENGVVLGS